MTDQQLNSANEYAIPDPAPNEDQHQLSPYAHSKFRQQRLPACRPYLTPFAAFIIYLVFCMVSLAFGVIYMKESNDIFEFAIPYSKQCDQNNHSIGSTCIINFTINEDIDGPFYIYYELSHFFQNNFLYGDSKNWDQLRGESYSSPKKLDSCKPAITSPEYSTSGNFTATVLVPCGAVPRSVFNDTFIFEGNGFPAVSSDNIALNTFRDLFKPANSIYDDSDHWMNETIFPDEQTNQHFINWVQLAPFSTFRKLYASTDENAKLSKGNYSVVIENRYPVSQFGGKKSLIIAKVKWIGGKNRFFGICFFVICAVSGIGAISFMIISITRCLPLYKAMEDNSQSIALSLVE